MIANQMFGVLDVYYMRVFIWYFYFTVTTLNHPFNAENMEELYKKVIRGYYPKIDKRYS